MKKKIIIYTILVTMILGVFSGCQSNTTGNTASENKTPKNGGKVVIAIPQDPDFLDPNLAVAAGTKEILFNIFEGLVKMDEKGNYNPAVASSYKISSDGLKYTFTLRDGIKFHNGNKVTVDDVKYSIQKTQATESGKALKHIKTIETPDSKTIAFNLDSAVPDFLSSFSLAYIIPKDYNDQNKKPIGTGPFKFTAYVPGQHLDLAKNADYWQKGVPHIDSAQFKIFTDYNAAFVELKAGTVDIYPRVTNDRADELGSDYYLKKGEQNMIQLLALNNKAKPFDDVKVRQALSYAINVDEIIKGVAAGYGTKLGSNMSPVMAKYYQAGLEKTYKTNIDKAKKLLKEAGYPNGFSTTITVPSNYTFHVDTAQVIVEQLKKIGVTAQIKQVEWGVWLSDVYKGRKFDSTIIGLTSDNTPSSVLGRYQSTGGSNFINYSNAEYDDVLAKAEKETDDKKRTADYKQLQTILTKDAASVYIQDPNILIAIRKNIQGYKIYPIYVQDLSSIYYTK